MSSSWELPILVAKRKPRSSNSRLVTIHSTPTSKDLIAKKQERGQSDEICASHDLAPLVEKAFGIRWSSVRKMKELKLQPANAKPSKQRAKKDGTSKMKALRRMLSRARLE
ncbi:hypothetical protein TEQG_07321 [Trichophyton equinum CBS 127.97]|uniref:Uncharacterized protein n=1 Tax=Trichophyton equinum (strain ATCC MYA-4606 / CBS 127.97) TaxID=559882 RepID=F2Q2H8_TRIEC|nr:hypothetical protein TEQG_07321 [Trichophyton equinum CBS 127.97]